MTDRSIQEQDGSLINEKTGCFVDERGLICKLLIPVPSARTSLDGKLHLPLVGTDLPIKVAQPPPPQPNFAVRGFWSTTQIGK